MRLRKAPLSPWLVSPRGEKDFYLMQTLRCRLAGHMNGVFVAVNVVVARSRSRISPPPTLTEYDHGYVYDYVYG